ncbi:hypothetical protein QUA54_27730 [Microcoleus sp. MOSTC5]|uniref:hypothetical protein n=1 Tax=Microcoleus sp. MOSTC5 TaxID=3055378 RepID=UPI002FD6B49A
MTRVATSARSLVVVAGILLTTLAIGALMGWVYFGRKKGLRRGKRFILLSSGAGGSFAVGD